MSDYRMYVIYNKTVGPVLGDQVGHTSIAIQKPDGTVEGPFGFWPSSTGKKAFFRSPGRLIDESSHGPHVGNGHYAGKSIEDLRKMPGISVSPPTSLNGDEYGRVQTYLENKKKNPGYYAASGQGFRGLNCMDIMQESFSAAGKEKRLPELFDKNELKDTWAGMQYLNVLKQKRLIPDADEQSKAEEPQEPGRPGTSHGDEQVGGAGNDMPTDPMQRDVATWSEDDVRSVMEHPDYQKGEEAPTGPDRHKKVAAYYALDDSERAPLVTRVDGIPDGATLSAGTDNGDGRWSLADRSKNSPELAAFDKTLFETEDEAEEIALKPVSTWTEPERQRVSEKVIDLRQGDPKQEHLDGLVRDWYTHVYGDGQLEYDDTGRMKQPQPKRSVPEKPRPAPMPDGRPLTNGLSRVAKLIRANSREGRVAPAVKTLQTGLNLVADAKTEEKPLDTFNRQQRQEEKARQDRMALAIRASQPLKEDGQFGAKTCMGVKRTLVEHGPGKVEEGFALGRFHDFAQSGDHSKLAEETDRAFGPLLRNPAQPPAPKMPRPESEALQGTLNDLGSKTFGSGWKPLKQDGWIGPKTTSAFSRVAKAVGADRLAGAFGSFLGFL